MNIEKNLDSLSAFIPEMHLNHLRSLIDQTDVNPDMICEELGDLLTSFGMTEDFEMNECGIVIEALIGYFNPHKCGQR